VVGRGCAEGGEQVLRGRGARRALRRGTTRRGRGGAVAPASRAHGAGTTARLWPAWPCTVGVGDASAWRWLGVGGWRRLGVGGWPRRGGDGGMARRGAGGGGAVRRRRWRRVEA